MKRKHVEKQTTLNDKICEDNKMSSEKKNNYVNVIDVR